MEAPPEPEAAAAAGALSVHRQWNFHPGLPSEQLALALPAATVAGDPLGLGVERPPPPPDPDAYDPEKERREYSRSLLNEQDHAKLEEEIQKDGFWKIEQVRAAILTNVVKFTEGAREELIGIDPEIMMLVDHRINYKIFIASDNVYTREELYAHFPFPELNVQPEAVFEQQEIGVFPAKTYSLNGELEYMSRTVGDETIEFVTLEDMVGAAARKNYKMRRQPLKIVKTKIYFGFDLWQDFLGMAKFFRGAARIARAQIAYGGGGGVVAPMMAGLFGGASGPLLIADEATLAAEAARREEELRRREEELRRREEELRREEEERRRRDEENQRRIEADMLRIEETMRTLTAMMASASVAASAQPRYAAAAAAAAAARPPAEDSVPL